MTKRSVLKILAVAGLAFMATVAPDAGIRCSRAASEGRSCRPAPIERDQGRGWLGIDKRIEADGTYSVTTVRPDSPAARAGLKVGDIITRIDSIRLTPATAKDQLPSPSMIGRTVPIGVQRGADRLILFATVIEIPEAVVGSLREQQRTPETTR